MPELWIPFGAVETLVTLQAENLGTVVQAEPEKGDVDLERYSESVRQAKTLFVCDANPTTVEFIRDLASAIAAANGLRVVSAAPKRIESGVPELKGKVTTLPPPLPVEGKTPTFAPELTEPGPKIFVGTARPDPLFGIIDAKIQASLNWVAGSRAEAARSRNEMEPLPFSKTESYDTLEVLAGQVPQASYLTVVPRGGRVRSVMEDAPFDAVRNGFEGTSVPQTKSMIVGSGGRGYDDTLSSAIRGVWSAIPALRRSGSLLLFAECSEGLGSPALEMLATGRITGETGRKNQVEGLEEVFYLNKLKEEYDVLLLSGLPDIYANSKLGLAAARGSGEAVGRLLNKTGRSGKVNVVTRAPESRLEST